MDESTEERLKKVMDNSSMLPLMSENTITKSDAINSIAFHNCVATVNLNCELDLAKIHFRARNTDYNPKVFSGLTMRIQEPKSTALVFRSGKFICTGTKNSNMALLAAKKFAKIIKSLGFNATFHSFKVENLVATCDFKFPIKLEDLNSAHGQFCRYEPEIFPGLIYRMVKPRLVMLIFVNGKIIFTGAKTPVDVIEALDYLFPVLKKFKKK